MTDYEVPDDASSLFDPEAPPDFTYQVLLYSRTFGDTMSVKVIAPSLVEAVELALTSTWDRVCTGAVLVVDE
jgi:hypothetical protein